MIVIKFVHEHIHNAPSLAYRHRSTHDFSVLPYLMALFNCALWLLYGLMQADATLSINSFGCLIMAIYI
ncbi:sugar efflux transporter for intercellular exchange protein [Medicago truncatula]|uniref:Sugar efflux transporter for intercellular exchange protein n=1 Tax=Medicago truncatula TaxID=3880 RepID=G7IL95_MEDTR|nr:sugar efflux transporter for intercellular exchange protein [Medicago truncatula]